MTNALQALQNQDGKWAAKVKEVEAAVQSLYNTTKEKTEEHVKSVANMEKWRLGAEEKEQFEAEIQKELDAANLEIEEVLGDRVQLDMQMITKQSDLKHEVDILTNRLKERDRATMQEREQEILVIKMQAQMPIFVQEKEKTQRELSLAELVTKKRKDGLEDIRKDIDILMNNFTVVENLSKEVARMQLETHRKVAMLEKNVVVCIDIEWKQSQHVNDLSNVYARLVQAAAKKQTQWKEVKDNAELQVNFVKNFQKRLIELEKEYKEFIVLYNLVRGQRNKYARVMEASALTIAEMKDKLRTLNTEVEQLQGEVLYKVKVLNKMHVDYALSVKARTGLRDEITKCASMVKDKKLVAEEYELEVINLENIIKKTEKDMVKAHKTYGLLVKDRNQVGISLIDRNDELCILYEKSNVQMELSRHSEVEIAKRMDEIAYLKRACNLTHTSIVTQHKTTPNPESVYMELASLKEQMEKACQDVSQLSDLMEKPSNLDRWRVLPGRDNTTQELTGKAVAIEEFLSAKEDQAYEKDLILEEVTTLAEDLMRKAAIARPESIRVGKQMNFYIRQMSLVTRQIMATVSELSLVQATAISMKQERESAQLNLDNASICLENGEPPTDDSERAWNSLLRQFALIHKTNSLRDALQQVEGEVAQGNKKLRLNTTAEQRPNAYIAEHLGLPKPFGKNSPFRPSEHGSTIRHIRKPQLKAVEV
ncbi:hypothetical protein BDL97_16G077700 [Sphagnum fallax]|nr:hypothetical protein BDL97_16G077700 [Sphagnum fallax]